MKERPSFTGRYLIIIRPTHKTPLQPVAHEARSVVFVQSPLYLCVVAFGYVNFDERVKLS